MYPVLTLKPDKVASVAFHHPWVFSGALGKHEPIEHGSLVHVADPKGKILGTGTYSNRGSIAIRVFDFEKTELSDDWFVRRFQQAQQRRELMGYGDGTDTTAYRLVFGESDGIPGLIVDRYESVLVMQLSTAGIEKLRPVITEALIQAFQPVCLIDRSDMTARQEEGLPGRTEIVHGSDPGAVEFTEYGNWFLAEPLTGQKTGFFLDQKDLRREIQRLAADRSVLNLFSYTGSNGVAALKGGAKSVHHVDSSEPALALCKQQFDLNRLDSSKMTTECADVFQWLDAHQNDRYDMVIMDPPALIKSQKDMESGRKAYHFLNRAALRIMNDGGILVSSSCSAFFTEPDFSFTLRRASVQAETTLHPLRTVYQSADHPVPVYFPEAAYLKSFICQVRR
ncbi:23S rRNA (cytosine(1962)-C(5))-methyltransferase RlmI [candidate division GN15 bacterium]|uniref:23S rRNA (Cytosine(1962)-C(5))-methyltransferase RlmI n=1 Tax=candidate division GN15 bacterium TaxID=2072418 RepID=A0A855X2L8_9BACT|nr:MAG: 23S rRNA (cytosine(1962)-C(5))-methyltransferase RlmI [candidate division GN15 bacterium]